MTKVDQNGSTHSYSFDLLGRMTADAITLASGNPQNVDASVLRIETSYNTQGLAGTITSFDATTGGNITNQVQNVYSGLGQLTTQYQVSCARKLTPLEDIDFPAKKGRKSDEEAFHGRTDRGDSAGGGIG